MSAPALEAPLARRARLSWSEAEKRRFMARIGAVFVAVIDSHPRNLGRGIALLRAAGIPVEVGTLAGDVESFIGRYLIR